MEEYVQLANLAYGPCDLPRDASYLDEIMFFAGHDVILNDGDVFVTVVTAMLVPEPNSVQELVDQSTDIHTFTSEVQQLLASLPPDYAGATAEVIGKKTRRVT